MSTPSVPTNDVKEQDLNNDFSGIYYNFAQLCAWWSVWTLFDTYLIFYTPWSEAFMLTLSVLLYVLPHVFKLSCINMKNGRYRMSNALERL